MKPDKPIVRLILDIVSLIACSIVLTDIICNGVSGKSGKWAIALFVFLICSSAFDLVNDIKTLKSNRN